jgi:hypothetical protein
MEEADDDCFPADVVHKALLPLYDLWSMKGWPLPYFRVSASARTAPDRSNLITPQLHKQCDVSMGCKDMLVIEMCISSH